jgi:hypothetical protein
MKSALKPALENMDKALARLETVLVKKLNTLSQQPAIQVKEVPQLDLSVRNERDVNRKIAAKLDHTINRLEMLLSEE